MDEAAISATYWSPPSTTEWTYAGNAGNLLPAGQPLNRELMEEARRVLRGRRGYTVEPLQTGEQVEPLDDDGVYRVEHNGERLTPEELFNRLAAEQGQP
jgi:hypothetical protein